jgi:hypothetical protein
MERRRGGISSYAHRESTAGVRLCQAPGEHCFPNVKYRHPDLPAASFLRFRSRIRYTDRRNCLDGECKEWERMHVSNAELA